MEPERRVDQNALRTNQAFVIGLLATAFVLDLPALVVLVAAVMLISALYPPLGLFTALYRTVLRPLGLVKPDVTPDNPEPHRFAQTLGGTFSALGFLLINAGSVVGWVLVGIVIVLASLNLFLGWCAGCTMYYWLNRLGVPGFTHTRQEVSQ